MQINEQQDRADVFAARVGLGLRELDGIDRVPDVRDDVLRRLALPTPGVRRPTQRWLSVAAALLAIGVTTALLVRSNGDRAQGSDAEHVATQDPTATWRRLVYELPLDELQHPRRRTSDDELDDLLARTMQVLHDRIGNLAVVARGDATTLTITLANAGPDDVTRVRSLVENQDRLELRMVANDDRAVDAPHASIDREQQQLQAWLAQGGRERVQQDADAIREYQAISEHVRWLVHLVRPRANQADGWAGRYVGVPQLHAVGAYAEGDWNGGTIPAHIQALPLAQRTLLEFVPIDMSAQHFTGSDLDPASVVAITDAAGNAAVDYRLRADRVADFAAFSEQNTGCCCAVIWNREVLSAPRFESRIPSVGRIVCPTAADAAALAAALGAPLPVTPRLLRSESGAPRHEK